MIRLEDDSVGWRLRHNRPRDAGRDTQHSDDEWVRRNPEYHVGRAAEHLRLLEDGEQLENHRAYGDALLTALTLGGIG